MRLRSSGGGSSASPISPPGSSRPRSRCSAGSRTRSGAWSPSRSARQRRLCCPRSRSSSRGGRPSLPRNRPDNGGSLLQSAASGRRVRPLSVMKTYTAKPGEIQREWFLVDAEGQTLGRLATRIANTLRGKGKPVFTPHVDTGDFVVVVNAEKIQVTGNKLDQKRYYRHSGYPGGLRSRTLREQLERRPEEVLRTAVKGMLPRNRLARQQLTKLKVYAGPEHPHGPQNPQPLNLEQ